MSQPNEPAGFPDPNAPSTPPYPTGPQSAPHPYGNPPGYADRPYDNTFPQQGSPYGSTQQNPYSASSATPYANTPPPPFQQPGYQQPGFQQQGYQPQNQYFPAVQPNPYGHPPAPYAQQKSKIAAGLLGLFLGAFGVHNFYLGKTGIGLVQLLCSILSVGFLAPIMAIWGMVEGILILVGSPSYSRDSRGIPLGD